MNKAPIFGLIILLFAACRTKEEGSFDDPPPLYSSPRVVELKTGKGYTINPTWGDTIQPVINSLGDTIITGRPIPLIGQVIYLDSMPEPEIVRARNPIVSPIKKNISVVPEIESVIPVIRDSLKSYSPSNAYTDYILVNSFNDTIPTGIRIPTSGKKVPCLYSRPEKLLLPRMMDKTRINLQYLDSRQNMFRSIMEGIKDSKGNLWLAGPISRIIRYNGAAPSILYKFEHGDMDGVVRSLIEDSRGNIWFACSGNGVTMFDGETYTWFTEREGLCNNYVYSILEDHHGNIWIGTMNGVSMYDGKSFIHYTEKEGLSKNHVYTIYEDSSHTIWFGTNGGGVCCFDGEKFLHLTEKDGLCFNKVYSILEDHLGHIWIGTRFGKVSKYDGDTFTNYIIGKDRKFGLIMSIIEDSNYDLWFGITDGGIARYDGEYVDLLTEEDGLSNDFVRDVLEVSDGQFWFATYRGGVNIYKKGSFVTFTSEEGLSDNFIIDIQEDNKGRLWFGTNTRGVNIYDGTSFTTYLDEHGLQSYNAMSMEEDLEGNMWISSDLGISRFDGEYFTHFTRRQGLIDDFIYDLGKDRSGNIWFSNGNGIGKYTDSCFTFYTDRGGLSGTSIWLECEDIKGNIWVGGYDGISKLSGDTIIHYTEKEGLSYNDINVVFSDSKGLLWIGTNGRGISVFNGETFTQITTDEGLCSNNITSICEDRHRNLWISTLKGLNYIECDRDHRGDDLVIKRVSSYGINDGLPEISFNIGNGYLDSQNRIWWGSGKGLTMLDLNTFHISEEIPQVQLEWLEINERYIDFRQSNEINGEQIDFSGVERFCNYPLDLKLQSSLNHLTFNFSAIDWSAPHKLIYSYMMEGMENNWSPPSSETRADYRNLPPGKFTFKIKAIGESQIWGEPFSYSFTILPPWYRTLLAQILYIIFLFCLVYLFIRYRTRRLMREKIKLEGIVSERTAELRRKNEQIVEMEQLKTRFFTNVSHEIRTPLSLISGPLDNLLQKEYPDPKTGNWLDMIKRNSQRLLQLVNQLLDISRLDSGKMKLVLEESDAIKHIRRLAGEYHSLAETRKIKYVMDIPDKELVTCYDIEKVEKIITNLLSNAFKFTPGQGTVTCRVKILNELKPGVLPSLRIIVADTGPGIPSSEREKIFERFYRAEGQLYEDAGGTGIGLSLTRELIAMMHGDVVLKSLVGSGAIFIVTIPMGKQHLKEGEYILKELEKTTLDEKPDMIRPGGSLPDQREEAKAQGIELLIVEDNKDLRTFIRENLSETYKISEAEDGLKGLNMAREQIPDLIISDVMMPGMDGMELCGKIKGDERTSHIPVIILTARSTHKDKMEGLELGADEYLFKPFNIEELTVRIRNLLEQRERLRKKYANMIGMDWNEMSVTTLDEEFLKKITATVTEYMDDFEFDVMSLQDKMAMSRGHLHRKLKALTGESPSSLIRVMRIKAAASMIEKSMDSITEISMNVGFSNPSHFAQCFREQYGMSPRQYRSKL